MPEPKQERPSLWLVTVQAILAYEWLISGIDKWADSLFAAHLTTLLRASTQGNRYGWYGAFLSQVILPLRGFFAVMVQVAEPSIGLLLLLGAGVWLVRPGGQLALSAGWAACLALVGSACLALNYFLQAGSPLPGVNPSSSLIPGLDVNLVIALLSLALLAANLQALRARGRPATQQPPMEGEGA
jgi:uncharacterized membrane protein YphA (DoxX/SURF4 family)